MQCPSCFATEADPFFASAGFQLVRCRSCRLVRVANPPSRDDLERMYSLAAGYAGGTDDRAGADALRALARRHLLLLRAHASPGKLLDVGCGAGYFLEQAAAGGWDARGIDLNVDIVRAARDRGLDAEQGRIEEVEIADGSLDAVTLWDSLEHVEDPRAALVAVRRALTGGGILAISTPNVDGLYPRASYPLGRVTGYWTHPQPPWHLYQFSAATLARLVDSVGFRVLDVVHEMSPKKYTLAPDGFRMLARKPGRALYAAVFLPALVLGPRIGRGDQILLVAVAT